MNGGQIGNKASDLSERILELRSREETEERRRSCSIRYLDYVFFKQTLICIHETAPFI